jgi:hypothetical protein
MSFFRAGITSLEIMGYGHIGREIPPPVQIYENWNSSGINVKGGTADLEIGLDKEMNTKPRKGEPP